MKREWTFSVKDDDTTGDIAAELETATAELCFDLKPGDYVMKVVSGKRTIPQNSLQHKWYPEISEYHGVSIAKAKCLCKFEFGIPILCRDDREFAALYDKVFKDLTYDQKIYSMMMMPITSLFNKSQAKEYMDTLYRTWCSRGAALTHPDDRGRIEPI